MTGDSIVSSCLYCRAMMRSARLSIQSLMLIPFSVGNWGVSQVVRKMRPLLRVGEEDYMSESKQTLTALRQAQKAIAEAADAAEDANLHQLIDYSLQQARLYLSTAVTTVDCLAKGELEVEVP